MLDLNIYATTCYMYEDIFLYTCVLFNMVKSQANIRVLVSIVSSPKSQVKPISGNRMIQPFNKDLPQIELPCLQAG